MDPTLLGLILGILQGLFEWLPVSSEGQMVIFIVHFFGSNIDVATSLALFAHIGTAFVVIVYYREEFKNMVKTGLTYIGPKEMWDTKSDNFLLTRNLIIVTICTVPTALPSLIIFEDIVNSLNQDLGVSVESLITLLVGVLLLVTGLILYQRRKTVNMEKYTETETYDPKKRFEDLSIKELVILGLLQGFAALPGISRSAITITYLLLGTKSSQDESLRGSFIVAVPVSLGAGFLDVIRGKILFEPSGLYYYNSNNILTPAISYLGMFILVLTAFVVGFLTLRTFLDLAKKVDFDKFVIAFGLIAIGAVLFGIILG